MPPDTPEAMKAYVRKVAARKNWIVNPEPDFQETLLGGLEQNLHNFGCLLCPCRDSDGQKGKDRDILCPCTYAAADIEEYGQCYCGLFLSPGKDPGTVQSIPERRPEKKP